mmetsp:Transcript_9560/g.10895  ORF Transcript_9560/g.10895 Transcript_9560/m.10895 type:complete len:225 (-) Transcript_9560:280-954(-)
MISSGSETNNSTGTLGANAGLQGDSQLRNSTPNNTWHFKLVLLGDTAVGKSCLVVRFVRDEFFEYQEPTIGAAFLTQTVSLEDTTVKFEIWDTAGQERYRSLAPMYYRGAAAAVVVFDITNKESYTGAQSWVKELQKRGDPNVVIALAGNKADCESERTVDKGEVETYAAENGIIYMETSAKTALNVRELFVGIAQKLPKSQPVDIQPQFPVVGPDADRQSACC